MTQQDREPAEAPAGARTKRGFASKSSSRRRDPAEPEGSITTPRSSADRLIEALLEGIAPTDAATQLGLSLRTVREMMCSATFATQVAERCKYEIESAKAEALSTLRRSLSSDNDRVALDAARYILDKGEGTPTAPVFLQINVEG